MKRVNCMVSDEAKGVLIKFQDNNKFSTRDEALTDLLENYYMVI